MRRLLAVVLSLFATAALAQAPVGVCINNVALTISNGLIAPVPFSAVTLCSFGSTASTCSANIVQTYADTTLTTLSPTTPLTAYTADAGGNYYFCAPHGRYALMISGSQGVYFVPTITLTDDWASGGTANGLWAVTSLKINGGTPITSTSSANPQAVTCPAGGSGTQYCSAAGSWVSPAAPGTGTVTSFNLGVWPIWLSPSVANPDTTPTLSVTASAIPNSALANSSTTVNGTPCTLGTSCTLPTPAVSVTANIVTGSRGFSTPYHNANTAAMQVAVSSAKTGNYGQDYGTSCAIGSTSGSLSFVATAGVTNGEGQATVSCWVPAGWYYQVYVDNTYAENPQTPFITAWVEYVF
jgi:hypothetical protein